ncbi:MAG: hypothetical protein KAU31_02080 [Spirochaetaceae bacterium]|nr:hypothetical protein [Spirochaetaceae bacterium]
MQDDFDLEGLSLAEAKAYVAQFIITQKQVVGDRAAADDTLELWKKRAGLAADRGELDLARESLARAEEAHAKLVRLKNEEREINFKVGELKRRFAKIRQEPQFSVDAGALLEQLEGIVGTDHETTDAVAEAEAEVALEALKKKMEAERDD